jgi:hypothetical protein
MSLSSLGKCAQLAAFSSPLQSSLENLSISSSHCVEVWQLQAVILQGKIHETITENPRRQMKKSAPLNY